MGIGERIDIHILVADHAVGAGTASHDDQRTGPRDHADSPAPDAAQHRP
jgi:hypothetical protein